LLWLRRIESLVRDTIERNSLGFEGFDFLRGAFLATKRRYSAEEKLTREDQYPPTRLPLVSSDMVASSIDLGSFSIIKPVSPWAINEKFLSFPDECALASFGVIRLRIPVKRCELLHQ